MPALDRLNVQEYRLARRQAIQIMRKVARDPKKIIATYPGLITYGEVSAHCDSVYPPLDPHLEVGFVVGDISETEFAAGRGMLSAIVIRDDTLTVGNGFFKCAKGLGLTVTDKDKFWTDQLKLVYRANARKTPPPTKPKSKPKAVCLDKVCVVRVRGER